ncbi:MAG: glycerol-3-phosphate acyltransferase [Chloroflexi bacterium]|nr:glycerol-3-phosphate acyltransferase [Chloroflexota bacterium]
MISYLFILAGYLIGSIPTAYILGRLIKGIDLRKCGDGNIGAANAYREIGPRTGIVVLFADMLKGAVAVIISDQFNSLNIVLLTGLATVIGHNWSIFIRFKGGRGQSTAVGVFTALLPIPMLILIAISFILNCIKRNTMLTGVILFVPLWLISLIMHKPIALVIFSIVLPCLVGITHYITTRNLPESIKKNVHYMR